MILTHFFNTHLTTPRRVSKMCWCFTRQTKHRISCNTLTTKLFSWWTEIAKTKWVSSTRMSMATISPQPLNLRAVWGIRTDRINRCLAPISTRLQMECLFKRMAIKEGRARTRSSLRSISLEGRQTKYRMLSKCPKINILSNSTTSRWERRRKVKLWISNGKTKTRSRSCRWGGHHHLYKEERWEW